MTTLDGQLLLKRYKVAEFIGRGGMAEVYKAWDKRRTYHVALKVLQRELLQDPRFNQGFRDEAEVLRKLRHPNIVRYYDFEEEGELAFLVIEYIEGESLRSKLTRLDQPMSLEQSLTILKPVCIALHFAHEEGVIHCDVKPANILIEKGGQVQLSDFGIARWTQQVSQAWQGGGAPAYMAPEQCCGGPIDRRADIYALGLTAYELLTLDRPFRGASTASPGTAVERVRWEQLNQEPPRPSRRNPAISAKTEQAILRALAKQPPQRQPTALDFLGELSDQGRIPPDATTHWPERPVKPVPPPSQPAEPAGTATTTQATESPSVWQRWGFRPPPRPQTGVMAKLEVIQGELPGQVYQIGAEDVHIGRAAGNQVRLYHRSVSRRHAIIRYANGRFYLQDQGSRHSTLLNGQRVEARPLNDGDRIEIGETEFIFHIWYK